MLKKVFVIKYKIIFLNIVKEALLMKQENRLFWVMVSLGILLMSVCFYLHWVQRNGECCKVEFH